MAGTLTRSRIEAFDQTANQLSQYAARWRAAAGDLDQTVQSYVSQIANPSGTQWQGQASAAALDAAHLDRVSVVGAVTHARDMAATAELGSSSLLGAREGALQAIAQAEADDFTVGDDLSVADNHYHADPATYAARMTQAEAHLGYIEHHAGLLEAENHRVAAQLGAGASQMGAMAPATWRTNGGPKAPDNPRDHKPKVEAVDHRWKQGPNQPPPPPGPAGTPFAGWTEAQKQGVAADIAHGHALGKHPGDFPPEWTERDVTRWIYDTMNDPTTRVGTSIDSGGTALLRDGRVVFIDPRRGDYGSVYLPEPRVQDTWRTPDEYFTQQTKPLEPLPPPGGGPARFPPLTSDEIAPPTSGPRPPAESAPHPATPPEQAPPVKAPAAPPIEEGPMFGGPGEPLGPQVVPPPHAHKHWLGESNLDEWEEGPAGGT
jgi:uncharacterized protein YukE